jgi:hypothetical protein
VYLLLGYTKDVEKATSTHLRSCKARNMAGGLSLFLIDTQVVSEERRRIVSEREREAELCKISWTLRLDVGVA